MYLVQAKQSNNDKVFAAAVTSFLLVGLYLTLQWTGLPALKQKTETYEEINWTRFKPKPQKIVETPQPVKPKVEAPPKVVPPPAQPKPKVERVDLSALTTQFETLKSPAQTLAKPEAAKTSGANKETAAIDLKKSDVLSGLNTLMGESSQKLKMPNRGKRGSGQKSTRTLKAGSGTTLETGSTSEFGGSDLLLGAPAAKTTGTGNAQVPMMDVTDVGKGFEDLSPIYRELIEWMKRNPATFPAVVNRFMEKGPGDLTSLVTFTINGRKFDMFLLCKEKLYEVRICLLEGNQSTYLIDRGFKENSSFLRVGSVNRTPTDRILSFGTTRKAASDNRTTEFYQVFLSWWESVK